MIDHLRSNRGKQFLYVLPIKPYPHDKVTNYSVAVVEVRTSYNRFSKVKVLSIVNENQAWPWMSYAKNHNLVVTVQNKYLFSKKSEN